MRQEALKNQGNTAFAMKDYDGALRHYAAAINIDPRDSGPQAHPNPNPNPNPNTLTLVRRMLRTAPVVVAVSFAGSARSFLLPLKAAELKHGNAVVGLLYG